MHLHQSHHGSVQVPAEEGDEPVLLRAQGQRLRALHGQQAPKGQFHGIWEDTVFDLEKICPTSRFPYTAVFYPVSLCKVYIVYPT